MRKTALKVALLFGIIIAVQACYYEEPPEPSPIKPEDVSFNTHVLPILVEKCATAECHDGTRIPDLRADVAYRELQKGGYYNVTFPEESILYISITDGIGGLLMPPSGSLSQLDKDLILTWIVKGAPND